VVPEDELLTQIAAWRSFDISESNGQRIDLAIGTKFPTYFARHPRKITWVFHQYRAIYDLCGTPYSEFTHDPADVRLRDRLIELDTGALRESRAIFSNAKNTAERMAKFNGLKAEALYHPPPLAGKLKAGLAGDYFLSVGRLEGNKRVDLIISALAHVDRRWRLTIVGEGPLRGELEALASATGVADRVTFTGGVAENTLVSLYAGAAAVVFPPYDEDFGYVTLEAFLARKPVVPPTMGAASRWSLSPTAKPGSSRPPILRASAPPWPASPAIRSARARWAMPGTSASAASRGTPRSIG
jgi:glycosyltransferase involved in cell wall biosynthesis